MNVVYCRHPGRMEEYIRGADAIGTVRVDCSSCQHLCNTLAKLFIHRRIVTIA